MHKIIFACFAAGKNDASKALLLAESIRSFAGEFSDLPFLLMIPQGNERLTKNQNNKIDHLAVNLHTFEIDPQAASFPFAGKVVASAAAETLSSEKASQLVWLDNAALVVNSVEQLLLERGIKLGYRPVDHLLIGSPYSKPIDPFWEFVYKSCGVNEDDIYPMISSTDQVKMRPYINAGMLVVRPEDKLLKRWRDTFLDIYQESQLLDFYQENHLYKIFIHQAVLAGCVMTGCQRSEIVELPHTVNYSLHMHAQYPPQLRASTLNQLVSCRYEGFFSKPDWQGLIQVEPPVLDWIEERESLLSRH
jgi:hypothetical protein